MDGSLQMGCCHGDHLGTFDAARGAVHPITRKERSASEAPAMAPRGQTSRCTYLEAPPGRSGAQARRPPWRRADRHRVARTFEAPWRVDGDRAAWRRAVENKPNRRTEAQSFPRTALRESGNPGTAALGETPRWIPACAHRR